MLEELGESADLALVLTSIGRLYRVHGQADQALVYYTRARDQQKKTDDTAGVIQSLNAMSIALKILGRGSEALPLDEEAHELARATGSPLLIKFTMEGLASTLLNSKQNVRAIQLLEEARLMEPPRVGTLNLLSSARLRAAVRSRIEGRGRGNGTQR